MITYLIPLVLLSILALVENDNKFKDFENKKYLYYLIALFFVIFIGLRYEIGCDWGQYKTMYNKYSIGFF